MSRSGHYPGGHTIVSRGRFTTYDPAEGKYSKSGGYGKRKKGNRERNRRRRHRRRITKLQEKLCEIAALTPKQLEAQIRRQEIIKELLAERKRKLSARDRLLIEQDREKRVKERLRKIEQFLNSPYGVAVRQGRVIDSKMEAWRL